jgi:hypothetical protein
LTGLLFPISLSSFIMKTFKILGEGKVSNSMISQYPTRAKKPMNVSIEEFSVESFIGDEGCHIFPSKIQWAFCLYVLHICTTYFNVKFVSHSKCMFYYFVDAQSFSQFERPSVGRQA